MPTPSEVRTALQLLTADAVAVTLELSKQIDGSSEARRAALLESVPEVIGYYGDGAAALAADAYDDERELAGVAAPFSSQPVVADRTVKIRRAVAWSSAPLFDGADDVALQRLSGVVQAEVARPFRDTMLTNRANDPESAGWRRITRGGCPMCRMLADRGAVYRKTTAIFAAHEDCHCTAQPVFKTDVGEEASVIQYMASRRNRTPATRDRLSSFLRDHYGA